MTTAHKAAIHILRRVTENADFAYLMLGTESLALCIQAVAEYRDEAEESIREKVYDNAASVKQKPEVVELRERVEKLESVADFTEDIFKEQYQSADEFIYRQVSAIEDLIRLAECGQNVLTVENLRNALTDPDSI